MDSTSADSEAASTSGNVRVFYIIFWSFFFKVCLNHGLTQSLYKHSGNGICVFLVLFCCNYLESKTVDRPHRRKFY